MFNHFLFSQALPVRIVHINESAPRPIHSISCNVCLSLCVIIQDMEPHGLETSGRRVYCLNFQAKKPFFGLETHLGFKISWVWEGTEGLWLWLLALVTVDR